MKVKKIIKIIIDTAMIILLPLLMAYSLIGETAHEWLGLFMFLLFILHHSMNPAWLRMLFKGRYTPLRIYITGINFLLLIVMFLQPISGILLSKHIFHFSGFGGISLARTVHLLLAYWGFILMSIHVGNHAGVHRMRKKRGVAFLLWTAAIAVSIYGAYAFANHDIASYLFLKEWFVFFDFGQPRLRFLLDYASIMCLFASIGAVLSRGLKALKIPKRGIS